MQEWIMCEDRMPEDGKWVVWLSKDNKTQIARYKEDVAYNHFYPQGRLFPLEEAIAWMPLPTTFKGANGV